MPTSVQRSASAPYSSRGSTALRRRVVVAVLIVLSLALISVYFRESDDGALHDVQGAVATVLEPFEVAADRVAQPFQDLYGYFAGLVHAKSEVERLRAENERLKQLAIQNEFAARENARLSAELQYRGAPTFPRDFRGVTAAVTAQPPSAYEQQIVIRAGVDDGVRRGYAVVTKEGLVGKVSLAFRNTARVTLLTDEDSAVSAVTLNSRARGIVSHAQGATDVLFLDRVEKEHPVAVRDPVYTSGWRAGRLGSLYPKGIGIGWVSSVGQYDIESYKRIQVTPFVDFSSLEVVTVLVPKRPALALTEP